MGIMVTIDFTKNLPFSIDDWLVTTWDGDASLLGMRSNTITHSQSTSWTVTAKFEYLKISYIVSSETNYDKFRLTIDGSSVINTGTTAKQYEITFSDGADHTLKFEYYKDGSGNNGYDACFIDFMQYSTVDNSLLQANVFYAVQAVDGKIYSLDNSGNVIKIADNLSSMTKDLYFTCTTKRELLNIRDPRFGNKPKLLKFSDNVLDTYLAYKIPCLKNPGEVHLLESIDFDYYYVTGIRKFDIQVDKSEGDIIKFALSLDDGLTWISWSGSEWTVIPIFNAEALLAQGNDDTTLKNLPEAAFETLFATKKMSVSFIMKPAGLDSNLKLKSFNCVYWKEGDER